MEVKIDQLIEKLKKEGVEGAQKSADEVLVNAKKEAEEIIAQAKKKADQLIVDAEKKAATFQNNSTLAIRQAARDGELLLKERITALFDRVFKRTVADTMEAAFLKDLIVRVASQAGDGDLEVQLSAEDAKALEGALLSGLKKEVKQGVDLKVGNAPTGGFHIGLKGSNVYYDFSNETIAEILKKALNPRLKEILESSNG